MTSLQTFSIPKIKQAELDELDRLVNAPESLVRSILLSLCADADIRDQAIRALNKIEALQSGSGVDDEHGTSKKRKAESDIQMCVQCREPFDADHNGTQSCRYHPGDLEFDDDASVWDSIEFGEGRLGPEDPEMKDEVPEGFKWGCCSMNGEAAGCMLGPHMAVTALKSR
ncbi:hypothetical protein F5Y16DRAFT_391453, partial [Xylariaceae sp. FL0255]